MAGLLSARIEPILADTICAWASTPCDPFPCGQDVWAFACAVGGVPEPALPPHGTRREMAALLRAKGGLCAYAGELMHGLGWEIADRPARGDVGVVNLPDMGLTCAICLSAGPPPRWMVRGDQSLVAIRTVALITWRAPCPKR